MDVLILFIIAVFGTAGFAILARALPWPKTWLDRKPLTCPACMSGWAGFAILGLWAAAGVSLPLPVWALLWFTVIGVAAPIFRYVYPPGIDPSTIQLDDLTP